MISNCSPPGLIARFVGPTWGPSGAGRTQTVGPMLAPWTLLSGVHYSVGCNNLFMAYINLLLAQFLSIIKVIYGSYQSDCSVFGKLFKEILLVYTHILSLMIHLTENVFPPDIAKSRSCEIVIYIVPSLLKLDRRFGSIAVKFRSDIFLTHDLATSRLCEIWGMKFYCFVNRDWCVRFSNVWDENDPRRKVSRKLLVPSPGFGHQGDLWGRISMMISVMIYLLCSPLENGQFSLNTFNRNVCCGFRV